MIAQDLESAIDELVRLVESARAIAPFTGAGISTECGIPDFRSPGGLWTKNKPIPFEDFLASREMRDEAWRRRFAMDAQFSDARPGRGHFALASLYRAGKASAVITQNIDNLHQSSGIAAEHVIELHGNNSYALVLTVGSVTSSIGCASDSTRRASARPIVRSVVDTSRPRRYRSDKPCLSGKCAALNSSRLTVIFFSQLALPWSYGQPPVFL
jgi:hypothetical protein